MKDWMKIALLVLVPVLALGAGFLVPRWLSGSGGDTTTQVEEGPDQALQLEIDQRQQAIDAANKLLETDANNAAALKSKGDAYLEKGLLEEEKGDNNEAYRSYKQAVDAYRAYLALAPTDYDARIDLAYTYNNLIMYEIAERELQAVVAGAPENQRGWHVYGLVLSQLDKIDEAIAAWQRSYELNPNTDIGQESKQFMDQLQANPMAVPGAPG